MKYTIEIEIPEMGNTSSSFANDLINEVDDEARQHAITTKINEATTKEHRKVLIKIIKDINKDLAPLNCEALISDSTYSGSNLYKMAFARLSFNHGSYYTIRIKGICEEKFHLSKYTTYTGAYILEQCSNSNSWYEWKDKESLLNTMRDNVKKHYLNSK